MLNSTINVKIKELFDRIFLSRNVFENMLGIIRAIQDNYDVTGLNERANSILSLIETISNDIDIVALYDKCKNDIIIEANKYDVINASCVTKITNYHTQLINELMTSVEIARITTKNLDMNYKSAFTSDLISKISPYMEFLDRVEMTIGNKINYDDISNSMVKSKVFNATSGTSKLLMGHDSNYPRLSVEINTDAVRVWYITDSSQTYNHYTKSQMENLLVNAFGYPNLTINGNDIYNLSFISSDNTLCVYCVCLIGANHVSIPMFFKLYVVNGTPYMLPINVAYNEVTNCRYLNMNTFIDNTYSNVTVTSYVKFKNGNQVVFNYGGTEATATIDNSPIVSTGVLKTNSTDIIVIFKSTSIILLKYNTSTNTVSSKTYSIDNGLTVVTSVICDKGIAFMTSDGSVKLLTPCDNDSLYMKIIPIGSIGRTPLPTPSTILHSISNLVISRDVVSSSIFETSTNVYSDDNIPILRSNFIPTDDFFPWYNMKKNNDSDISVIFGYDIPYIDPESSKDMDSMNAEYTGNAYSKKLSHSPVIHDMVVDVDNYGFSLLTLNCKTGESYVKIVDDYEPDIKIGNPYEYEVEHRVLSTRVGPGVVISVNEPRICSISLRRHGELSKPSPSQYYTLSWNRGIKYQSGEGIRFEGPGPLMLNPIEPIEEVYYKYTDKPFKSPIVTKQVKTLHNHFYSTSYSSESTGNMDTKVYDDFVVTCLNPKECDQKSRLSLSFDNGRTWVIDPINEAVSDVVRVDKEVFVFKKVGSNYIYVTFDMFMSFESTGIECEGTPTAAYSRTYGSYVEFKDKLCRVDHTNKRLYVINNGFIDSRLAMDANGDNVYLFKRSPSNTCNVYRLDGNSQVQVFNFNMFPSECTGFEYIQNLDNTPVFIFHFVNTIYYGNQTLGYAELTAISYGDDFTYRIVNSGERSVIVIGSNTSMFNCISVIGPSYGGVSVDMTKSSMRLAHYTGFGMINVGDHFPKYFDNEFGFAYPNGGYKPVSQLVVSNGKVYVTVGGDMTACIDYKADDNSFVFLGIGQNPGTIGVGKLRDIVVTKGGVSLLTVENGTIFAIDPLTGFTKIHGDPYNGTPSLVIPGYVIVSGKPKSKFLRNAYGDENGEIVVGTNPFTEGVTNIWIEHSFTRNYFESISHGCAIVGYNSQSSAGASVFVNTGDLAIGAFLYNGDVYYMTLGDDREDRKGDKYDPIDIDNIRNRGIIKVHSEKRGFIMKIDNHSFDTLSFNSQFHRVIENAFINTIKNINGKIWVFFDNRNPIVFNDMITSYKEVSIKGYDNYTIVSADFFNGTWVACLSLITPPFDDINNGMSSYYSYRKSNLVLTGPSLDDLEVFMVNCNVASVRYDTFRELVYFVHVDKLVIYNTNLEYMIDYNVNRAANDLGCFDIEGYSKQLFDYDRFTNTIETPWSPSGFVLDTPIDNGSNGRNYIVSTRTGEWSYDFILDRHTKNFYPRHASDKIIYNNNGVLGIVTMIDKRSNVFKSGAISGYFDMERHSICISRLSGYDMTHISLNPSTHINQSKQTSAFMYGDIITMCNDGYMSIFRFSDDIFEVIFLNIDLGSRSHEVRSFIMVDNLLYFCTVQGKIGTIDITSQIDMIYTRDYVSSNSSYNTFKFTNIHTDGLLIYVTCNVLKMNNIDCDKTVIGTIGSKFNPADKTLSNYGQYITLKGDKILSSVGGKYVIEYEKSTLFTDESVVRTDISMNSFIGYDDIRSVKPIYIDSVSLNDSSNRNFDTLVSNDFTYGVSIIGVGTGAGHTRDFNTEKIYEVSNILDDKYSVIHNRYTDRYRIDLSVEAKPRFYDTLDPYYADIYNGGNSIISSFITNYDTTTSDSPATFTYAKNIR